RVEQSPAGRTLFREGDPPHYAYVVVEGNVDLVFNARRGARKTLRVARAGDLLGLGDVVAGTAHDCTATTRTSGTIGALAANDLHRVLAETPSLWLTVLALLSSDINACYESLRGRHTAL